MCNSARHKHQLLSLDFCEAWQKMEKIQTAKQAELNTLITANDSVRKAYKKYRAEWKTIIDKWQAIYEPEWEKFDKKFNTWKVE